MPPRLVRELDRSVQTVVPSVRA